MAVWKPLSIIDLQEGIKERDEFIDELREQVKQAHASLRDKFAMAALTGMMGHDEWAISPPRDIAEAAYRVADAMVEQRSL